MSGLVWKTVVRPVLAAVAIAWDAGVDLVDVAEYAERLGLTAHQVSSAVGELAATGFLEAQLVGGDWRVMRVCPLTRQILGHAPESSPAGRFAAVDLFTVHAAWKR